MKTRTINFIIAIIVVIAGIIGAAVQAENHNHEVMVAKAITHANNMMAWEEYKEGREERLHSLIDAYVYRGEEDAPELAEANYWLGKIAAAEKKLRSVPKDEYASVYSSYRREADEAAWNAGRCLVAWSERTGRCAASYGEGYEYIYFYYNEDGSRRERAIYYSNREEVNSHLAQIRKAFPGI